MSKDNKESKLMELISSGCIAAFYTLDGWFCKIYPACGIDKVKFSFAQKGKAGEGFDVYVEMFSFLHFTEDVISYRFVKALEADTGNYPAAWKVVTGENGAKEVIIGKGQKGIVIQGRNKELKANAFVPVLNYNELWEAAMLFQLVTGYKQAAPNSYFGKLKDAFLDAQKRISEERKKYAKNENEKPEPTKEEPQDSAKESQTNTAGKEAATSTGSVNKTEDNFEEVVSYKVFSTGQLSEKTSKTGKVLNGKGVDANGELALYFTGACLAELGPDKVQNIMACSVNDKLMFLATGKLGEYKGQRSLFIEKINA